MLLHEVTNYCYYHVELNIGSDIMNDVQSGEIHRNLPKTTVIGAGALGTFYAAMLSASGLDVTLVCRERDVETLRKGILITGLMEQHAHPAIATVPPVSDLIFVAVKTYDIPSAVRGIRLKPDTIVVVIHNGLGGDEAAAYILGPGHAAAGVSYSGVTFLEPGAVKLAGFNELVIGSIDPEVNAHLGVVREALVKAGLEARVAENIRTEQWEKLYTNIGVNAITAITGLDNGTLADVPELRFLVVQAVREAVIVSVAAGVRPHRDPVENTFRVIEANKRNRSSMLQDILKGKRTEIDAINGMVCAMGRKAGIPTPFNDTITALVKGIEKCHERERETKDSD
jgi:2-dehydropantoate 2-reductase